MTRAISGLLLGILVSLSTGTVRAADPATDPNESAEVAAMRKAMRALAWIKGPTAVGIGTNATLEVPQGFVSLSASDTAKFSSLIQNPPGGTEWLIAPQDLHWFAILSYLETGYVKDKDTLDADAILKSISDGTEAVNDERRKRGWPEMHVVGWRIKPAYNQESKHLEWAIDGRSQNGETSTNFFTKILGRHGVTTAVLVTDPTTLAAAVPEFKRTIVGYSYKSGETYAEFRPGDKVAEYGLAGLIAGGAVAVAAKTGAFKWLWKLALAGGVAGLAALRKLFGRRPTPT
jgi:uncharacterized membrane-anchored protein